MIDSPGGQAGIHDQIIFKCSYILVGVPVLALIAEIEVNVGIFRHILAADLII